MVLTVAKEAIPSTRGPLEALCSISNALSTSTDLNIALQRTLELLLPLFPASGSAVYLLDQDTGALSMTASAGLSPDMESELSLCPSCLDAATGWPAMHVQNSVTIEPLALATNARRPHSAQDRSIWARHGYDVLISVPLQCRQMLLGVLTLGVRGSRHLADDKHELLIAVANQIGMAVANAGLSEAVQTRQTQESLRESEERFRALCAAAPIGLYQADVEGRSSYINPRWQVLSGLTYEQSLGCGWSQATHPEDRDRVFTEWLAAVRSGREYHTECRLTTPEGIVRWVRSLSAPLRSSDGRVTGYVGAIEDITERKRAEDALQASEAELRRANQTLSALIHASPCAIVALDVDARVTLWNPAAERTFGWTADEVLGRPLPYIPEEFQHEFDIRFRQSIEGGAFSGVETRRRQKEGSIIDVALSSAPTRDISGKVNGSVAIFTDITERKRADLALAEQAHQAAFAADVGVALTASDVLSTSLQRCAAAMVQHLDAAVAQIWTLNPTERMLELQATAGPAGGSDAPGETDDRSPRLAVGQSRVGRIAEAREPYLTDKAGDDSELNREWAQRHGLVAFSGHPLVVDDRLVGVMAMFAREPLTEATSRSLKAAADVIALGIERKWAEEELKGTVQRLNILVEMARSIDLTLDILLYWLIRRLVADIPAADCGTIFLYDPEANALLPAACVRYDKVPCSQIRLQPGESMCGRVFETGCSLLADTPEQIDAYFEELTPENACLFVQALETATSGRQKRIVSSICAPLRARTGAIIGTLSLSSLHSRFTKEDLVLLEGLAAQAAAAIQNARLFAQVEAGRKSLQSLSHRLVEMQESERRQIARELHDEVGQLLTRLDLLLELMARSPAGRMRERLGEAQALVSELTTRVRELSLDLRPAMLDDLGLLPALLWHFDRYMAQTGVRVNLEHAGLGQRFRPEVETAAYRIVQEALTNVARHADVREVTVRLWVNEKMLGVQIADRGPGFDPTAALASGVSSGLVGMRERATLAGGRFVLESAPGQGARLMAEFPLDPPASGKSEER